MVLYEDLRIEIGGFQASSIEPLDFIDVGNYRRRYFLRRSIGTIYEFSQALHSLNKLGEFQEIKARFSKAATDNWNEMIQFFKKNEHIFRNVRNDLGGHFGEEAADYSVSSFLPGTTGNIELCRDYSSNAVMFKVNFVGEITARAFLRHLKGRSTDERIRNLMKKTRDAYRLAARSVTNLIDFYLWDRFV
ncbi:hypothetical protein MYX82_03915 [Acidobacteria bacterium AH-259-D05]|nr:hypothetical protein [Acidobacteria bacterium AH-259-D05]